MKKNKLKIDYWLRKIYTTKFFQLLPINKDKMKKKIFTSIYKSNHWVQNSEGLPEKFVSVSGHGSNINTAQYKNLNFNFNKMLEKFDINSIIDMPCGDFLWIKNTILEKKIKYLGIDIVDELIFKNNKIYKNNHIEFLAKDIVDFKTEEKYDLVLIRDLFIHIKNSDIKKIINNIKKMQIKYIALNSYEINQNEDVVIGKHRKVNILSEPFNLPKPIFSFSDYEKDKFIYLYKIDHIIPL